MTHQEAWDAAESALYADYHPIEGKHPLPSFYYYGLIHAHMRDSGIEPKRLNPDGSPQE